MKYCEPHKLSRKECGLIVGLLEDIQWSADDRRLIESIIRKLGGTIASEVHGNV